MSESGCRFFGKRNVSHDRTLGVHPRAEERGCSYDRTVGIFAGAEEARGDITYKDWYSEQSDTFKKSTLSNKKYNAYLKGNYKVNGVADLNKKNSFADIKKVLKDEYVTPKIKVPDIKFGYDGKFDGYVSDIRDEAKIVIDRLPKPNNI